MALEGQHASCASKHFDGQDVRKKRAAERRAKFLQQGLSQEGPRSCSPPPSPTFPPPGSGPYVPLIGEPHVVSTNSSSIACANKPTRTETASEQVTERLTCVHK